MKGRVIDELGEPVVGAQVCAGVTSMLLVESLADNVTARTEPSR